MRCYAYADESGNSGLKLFGDQQDTFWTGTLISFSDLDSRYGAFHQELLHLAGKPELHGNELGFGRIEKIAARLAWFIREKKIRFSFVRIFKPYLATTKMFDLAFDSGANPAVPPQSYGIRQLRLINLLHFSQLLATEDLNEFWSLFQAQSPERFGKLLASIRDRVKHTPYDKRSKQILTEALDWASRHPEEVLDPFGERDSPNFVAFTAIFDHLHSFHEETGHTIGSFVHDEQNQFVPKFVEAFDLLSKFHGDEKSPFSMASDISPISSFDCTLDIRSSSASFGLQLVDVCIWLAKRVIEKRNEPRGNCATLFQCLAERSYIKEYDFDMLVREVKAGADLLAQCELTEEEIAKARRDLAAIEEARKRRLSANP
ncbi:MAG TPA: DUF3800 domain-containing protein [Acidobacteriaceae bacterium]|nr:DUF3800 domain-containing protein [Acidobacteriaceae bacterium]